MSKSPVGLCPCHWLCRAGGREGQAWHVLQSVACLVVHGYCEWDWKLDLGGQWKLQTFFPAGPGSPWPLGGGYAALGADGGESKGGAVRVCSPGPRDAAEG